MFDDPTFYIRVTQNDRVAYYCNNRTNPSFRSDPSRFELSEYKTFDEAKYVIDNIITYSVIEGSIENSYDLTYWADKDCGPIKLEVVAVVLTPIYTKNISI